MTEFFMSMIPPTTTHQEKRVRVVKGKPIFYEPAELKQARAKLLNGVSQHLPAEPYHGAVRLTTKWIWPTRDGVTAYKVTKPDTDNMIKLLKDCMTKAHFWHDDAQVASEITEKFLGEHPGIYIKVESISL